MTKLRYGSTYIMIVTLAKCGLACHDCKLLACGANPPKVAMGVTQDFMRGIPETRGIVLIDNTLTVDTFWVKRTLKRSFGYIYCGLAFHFSVHVFTVVVESRSANQLLKTESQQCQSWRSFRLQEVYCPYLLCNKSRSHHSHHTKGAW